MKTSTILGKPPGGPLGSMFGHNWADNWNQFAQDPLKAKVASIIDPLGLAKKNGTLTYDQVQSAYTDYQSAINDFKDQAAYFETLDNGAKTVVEQARKTTDPIIAQWQASFDADLAAYKPAETPTDFTPPTLDTAKPADAAAVQQKKRAIASPGRAGTILGGTVNQPGFGLKPKTILGY